MYHYFPYYIFEIFSIDLREREREWFVVPLSYARTVWFLHVPWTGVAPTP